MYTLIGDTGVCPKQHIAHDTTPAPRSGIFLGILRSSVNRICVGYTLLGEGKGRGVGLETGVEDKVGCQLEHCLCLCSHICAFDDPNAPFSSLLINFLFERSLLPLLYSSNS